MTSYMPCPRCGLTMIPSGSGGDCGCVWRKQLQEQQDQLQKELRRSQPPPPSLRVKDQDRERAAEMLAEANRIERFRLRAERVCPQCRAFGDYGATCPLCGRPTKSGPEYRAELEEEKRKAAARYEQSVKEREEQEAGSLILLREWWIRKDALFFLFCGLPFWAILCAKWLWPNLSVPVPVCIFGVLALLFFFWIAWGDGAAIRINTIFWIAMLLLAAFGYTRLAIWESQPIPPSPERILQFRYVLAAAAAGPALLGAAAAIAALLTRSYRS